MGGTGHRWVALMGTGGRHCWALIIRALIISADPFVDNCQFSAVLSSCCDSVRKVQPITSNC
ncbi:unnamed protein product, partial [Staurois parvus]